MMFDKNLRGNLIMTREYRRRPWQLALVLAVLLVVAIVVWSILFGNQLWRRGQSHEKAVAAEEITSKPKKVSTDPGRQLMPQMRALMSDRALIQAREKGYEILGKSKNPAIINEVENLLGTINTELLLTPMTMPEKQRYLVKRGDTLDRIARQFGTTIELIKKSNELQRNTIHIGDRLRIFNGTFSIVISKSRNDLVLKMNDRFFKRYNVGTGKHGKTPAGIFVISKKITEPPWWRSDGKVLPFGDKENVLGTRWMSIAAIEGTDNVRGYGVHGTWEPETIGKQASDGCVRLLNSDVEELFMMVPVGTRVVVSE